MEWLLALHPIRFFSFYLMFLFAISTLLRLRQYHTMLNIVVGLRSRWPNLAVLVLGHRHIFLTWSTLLPLILVLGLWLLNTLASRFVWTTADRFTVADLLNVRLAVPVVLLTGLAMLLFDLWTMVRVGEIDQKALEVHFDQAEYWLKGWKAPVVHFLSLGFVNPRQIVAKEVNTALMAASAMLNSSLWWVSLQTALRILFGLTLWGSCAMEVWLRTLVGE
jgi:hypothetical protein